jgi:uncharacterized membrane protein YdbT with pleckstrin-like domain
VSYVDRNLAPGETVLHRARYHWIRFVPSGLVVLAGLVLASGSFVFPDGGAPGTVIFYSGLAVFLAGWASMAWRAVVDSFDEYVITSFRVVCKQGFLTRVVRQVPLEKVQDLNLHATLWGRWLSYGDVEVQTAGADSTVLFPRIAHPEEFRNVLFAHLQGRAPAAAGVAVPAARPVTERMEELERLKTGGLVSEAEYRTKREALLKEL